jgi:hypothetical protein
VRLEPGGRFTFYRGVTDPLFTVDVEVRTAAP